MEASQAKPTRVTLEVCIASVADAVAARDGGADRLELNCALAVGGLTPSLGLLREVRQAVDLPLIVMIRPRAGGFNYSDVEFAVMQRDAEIALEYGADGLALGILQHDGTLDAARTGQMVELAKGREVVFHRAFDALPYPLESLAQLADLGICRIMTSGQCETALAGSEQIANLVAHALGRIEILPAGKIAAANVGEMLAHTGCRQVHAALRTMRSDPYVHRATSTTDSQPMESYEATCPQAVRDLRAALDGWQSAQTEK